ncbi:unnamed protein product [Rotaria magnacalcarata]|uniref:Uncharacterized protein n=1 Tax=Rotaria magnacalcarata TaxID=392030 RepID=A0A820JHW2_9BILA|nr:unnamed protein product [Rotaria magnacalcarata]CAF2147359.1 unnamed protein product [Rotaria magnacalcarata]CAF4262057.1 unnamed protein product [Rotaria magnacalcarata]CAF4327545.1 unnamed protein product [Rotaria magnacalcarata]
MLFRFIIFVSLIFAANSKPISLLNITKAVKKTTTLGTTTVLITSTTATLGHYEEEVTTTTTSILPTDTIELNKSYEFQSNFSRNNDAVFISINSNASDSFVSINNTFTHSKYDHYPCEIVFNEHSNNANQILKTTVIINFNRSLTRDMAIQLGDRMLDIVDLLTTIQLINHQNMTVETDS